jgi:putative membrane protein
MLNPSGPKDWNLHEPQRQSLLGVVVYILRNIRAIIAIFLSFLAVGAANPQAWFFFSLAMVPLGIFLLVFAYYQFKNFTFHVNEDKLLIHKGVFIKDRLVVEAERIQSINITENFIQRLIGLVSLKVDTAGSKGNELEIPALERDRAELLKKLLYEKKAEAVGEDAQLEADAASETTDSKKRILVSLSLGDLIVVGLTENHLRTGLIALAFVFGTYSQYQEYITEYFEDPLESYAEQAVNAGLAALVIFIIVYSVVSVLLSLGRTILRFFNLKAFINDDAIEISTGLLKRNEFRVPIHKVQFLQLETNPLRRAVGFESAKIKPSNSVGEVAKQQNIEIPALRSVQSSTLIQGVFENFILPEKELQGNAWAYARLNAIIFAIITIPITLGLYSFLSYFSLVILLLIPSGAVFGYFYGKTVRLFYDESFIVIRKGLLFTKRIVLPTYKIQSIKKSSNLILKRRKLSHIDLYTAAGSRAVRFLNTEEIDRFYDFVLYSVEKNSESWM